MTAIFGPNIPLINEYRHALDLFKSIESYLQGSFTLIRTASTGQETTVIDVENWRRLIEVVREETFKGYAPPAL